MCTRSRSSVGRAPALHAGGRRIDAGREDFKYLYLLIVTKGQEQMIKYNVKVYPNGSKYWYLNEELHREDGPAIERAEVKRWYLNGKLHREDGPAIEYSSGEKHWLLNGHYHREDGPAVEYADGDKYWYLNGKLHREDGPALEYLDASNYWYINGKLHREDGPALEYADGRKVWYLDGEKLTEEEWKKQVKKIKEKQETSSCDGKIVTIDGVEYVLREKE